MIAAACEDYRAGASVDLDLHLERRVRDVALDCGHFVAEEEAEACAAALMDLLDS